MTTPKIKIVCSHCGGENVMRDAYAAWNPETQQWELGNVFDQGYCEDCGGEATLDELPLEDSSPPKRVDLSEDAEDDDCFLGDDYENEASNDE